MAIVRPHSRRPWWHRIVAIALSILALALAAIIWGLSHQSDAGQPAVSGTVERIQAELDVLQLSLYTEQVVRDGQVLEQEEYAAAQSAVQRARAQWETIREAMTAEQREHVDRLFEELQTAVNTLAPAAEVQKLAEEIQQGLRPFESPENSH